MKTHRLHIILLLLTLFCLVPMAWPQRPTRFKAAPTIPVAPARKSVPRSISSSSPTTTSSSSAQKTMIYLENAETLSYDEDVNPDAQLLKGNVRFRHDDIYLYCDSAHFFTKKNSFNAYGHVKIVQGDTLFIFGDVLYYDGNTKMARLRRHVRMNNRNVTLVTDSLNYDRLANVGYYYTGGKLYDPENVLTSVYGYYYPGREMALFRGNVLLTNADFVMKADTLKYYTATSVAEILGPTNIIYENETTIYSELGQYDTKTEQSTLLRNSWVKHIDGQTLIGDTIFYDKLQGEGQAFSNVQLNDSANEMTLYGNYVYYKEEGDIALAHDSALMVEHSTEDTIYLNADTLFAYAIDSTYKMVQAFHHVRMFRYDVQAVCDSACFDTRDSVLHLTQSPIAWSGPRQITGDTMHIYSVNGEVERLHVKGAAFVCDQQDTTHYNQLSGKELIAYIEDRDLRRVEIRGNAESLFFPLDDDSLMIGLNQTESSFLTAYLYDQKIERIVLYPSPTGVLTPITQVTDEMLHLTGFTWQKDIRPMCWQDVFARPNRQKYQAGQRRRHSGHTEESSNSDQPKKEIQDEPTIYGRGGNANSSDSKRSRNTKNTK